MIPMNNPRVWVPVKVLPGKKALDFFYQQWQAAGKQPFNGEIELQNPPKGQTAETVIRAQTIDIDKVSHAITDIKMETFDPQKLTVMAQVTFCGPHGNEAVDKYVTGKLRFAARTLRGVKKSTGEPVEQIITWDCVTDPGPMSEEEKQKMKAYKKSLG